ncbi:MAG TPA: hypothetical protein VF042_12905 [Gemmatimonadaceae bacterium]
MLRGTHKHGAVLSCAIALAIVGCSSDSSMPTEMHDMAGLPVSAVAQASNAQALNDLRRLTAPLHTEAAAIAAQYGLLILPPLTAPDGCISDMSAGGMGYHYTQGDNLGDDSISLLDPEFLVYAPTKAAGDNVPRRLAALEYFIPYSATWPGPGPGVTPPSLGDFPSFAGLPDVAMSPTRFGGWAIHIWLWENNPGGMLTNYNTSVPKCDGSTF